MSKTVTILSKEFIESRHLEELAKSFAKQNSLLTEYEQENEISIWHGTDDGSTIEVIFGTTEEEFNNALGTYNECDDYSHNLLISYFKEDQLLVPFLRELVKTYPDILVYNDESISKGAVKHYTIHTKNDIEEVADNDYWSLLGRA